MKRTSEAITPRTPDALLAVDLKSIVIDTSGSNGGSISAMADLTQQRRQVGQSGRGGGGEIGRLVRSAKALCTKVTDIIKNLKQECQGLVSLLINQHVLVFDSDEKNFCQTALN